MGILQYPLSETERSLLGFAGTLFVTLIGIIGYRVNTRIIAHRKIHLDNISKCIAPFNDAIANIHLGVHNHIFIMNSFFRSQEEAIMIFMANINKRKSVRIRKSWDAYKKHHENNAKGHIYERFASIPEPSKKEELNLLHKYLSNIIKEIEKT